MRANIFSEAGISTRLTHWWESIPFSTSSIVVLCGSVYLVCLLIGYDSFYEVCFLPSAVTSHFQAYRAYTSIIFHGSLLHVVFNMLALVPLGGEVERIMGTVRFLYVTILLATTNAVLHLAIALLVFQNPFHSDKFLMNECSIGFSGIVFSLIVIETSLNGAPTRSLFGICNVPAKLYPWILLLVFQLLMSNASLLGHLCGILSGFAYAHGLLNMVIPGTLFFTAVESSSPFNSAMARCPKFILCAGGASSSNVPTRSPSSRNLFRTVLGWIPRTQSSAQVDESGLRFPGHGRTVGGSPVDSGLETRLLERSTTASSNVAALPAVNLHTFISMGFDKTQAEVALEAADGDPNTAFEILATQQKE